MGPFGSAKRAERLLKRYGLKVSDITGSSRTPKKTDGDTSANGKRKDGGGQDEPETPTKRQRTKRAVKKEEEIKEEDGMFPS